MDSNLKNEKKNQAKQKSVFIGPMIINLISNIKNGDRQQTDIIAPNEGKTKCNNI